MTYPSDPQSTRELRDAKARKKSARQQIIVAVVIAVLVLSAGGYCFYAVLTR
jgi:flagellar basal body-associated protein FliL